MLLVVLVPVLAGSTLETPEPGRAEMIIRAYVDADKIKRLEFALNDTGGVTPRRAAAWRAAATAVAAEFADGASTVAFGTLGDPNLYSTFSYLAQTVRDLVPGVDVQTVAGITAMQDLASRAGISLAEGTEPVTLVPLNGGAAALEAALASGGTVVGYKVGAAASPAPHPAPQQTIEMIFEKIPGGAGKFNLFLVNGKPYPHEREFVLQQGLRYRLVMRNRTDDAHPMHMHRHLWEIRSVNDKPTSGLIKDTVVVPYYGRAVVDFTADQPGLTLFHCHIQQHMDYGFKALFRYA